MPRREPASARPVAQVHRPAFPKTEGKFCISHLLDTCTSCTPRGSPGPVNIPIGWAKTSGDLSSLLHTPSEGAPSDGSPTGIKQGIIPATQEQRGGWGQEETQTRVWQREESLPQRLLFCGGNIFSSCAQVGTSLTVSDEGLGVATVFLEFGI